MVFSKIAKLNDERLHGRISENQRTAEDTSEEHRKLLKEVKVMTDKSNDQIKAGIATITGLVRLEWTKTLGEELKSFMRNIIKTNMAIYHAVLEMRKCLPSHLERSLYQEPFILEDGIGRIAPVHVQFITSWEAFDFVLEERFRDMQGLEKVKNKEYVLQETATRRDIDRRRRWEASFLPGQRVAMSMLFDDVANAKSSCPRCKRPSDDRKDMDIQW